MLFFVAGLHCRSILPCLCLAIRGIGEGASLTLDRLVGQLTETLLNTGVVILGLCVVIIAVEKVLHIVGVPPALAHASIRMVRFLHIIGRGVSRLAFHLRCLAEELSIGIRSSAISLIGSTHFASIALKQKLCVRILPAMMHFLEFMCGRAGINRLDFDIQG